jgi:hypothetical protein
MAKDDVTIYLDADWGEHKMGEATLPYDEARELVEVRNIARWPLGVAPTRPAAPVETKHPVEEAPADESEPAPSSE